MDTKTSPQHYKQGKLETWDIIDDVAQYYDGVVAYYIGNIIKYIVRAPHKGELLEDLKKARTYLDRVISKFEDD